jgi:hypothetical protein
MRIILIIAVVGIFSCKSKEDSPRNIEADLAKREIIRRSIALLQNNPDSMALSELKRDSIYFLGVMGYALDVPGVDNYYKNFSDHVPVKVIEGTGDFITSKEVAILNDMARKYCLRYNNVVLRWIKDHK